MTKPTDAITADVTSILSSIVGREVAREGYATKVLTATVMKWYHQGAIDAIDEVNARMTKKETA